MKKTILSIVLILSVLACFGQADSTTVPFVSYWSIGDSYDFQITKIRRQYRGGEITKDDSTSYIANFTVIDSTDTSYRIKWSFKTNLIGIEFSDELAERLSKYELTEVIYTTSELGNFTGVENWEDISKMTKEIFAEVMEYATEEDSSFKEALQKAITPILTAYSSKEGVENYLLRELKYIHFPFGLEYAIADTIEYEEDIPNMFGGNPIKGDTRIYLESIDFQNSYCVLIHEMKLNPDDTKAMMNDLFDKMDLKAHELTKAMETSKVEVTDNNRYEYWYYPGVPNKIATYREAISDIVNERVISTDITRIELIE